MKSIFCFCGFFCTSLLYAQDHNLNYFVQQAQSNSPLLQDFRIQVLSNRLDSQILRASFKTQVNFISSNSYAPVIRAFGYDPAITNGANISALLQANRNFYTPGNVAIQFRAIGLLNQALADTIRISEQDLKRAVTDQYIIAYGDQLALDFNQEVYQLLQREEVVLKKLTQASVYKQTDYLSFYVTLQQQALALSQARLQFNADYLGLNYLAGLVDTAVYRLPEPELTDTSEYDFYRSVFYQKFSTDSLLLQNERDLIRYSYRPRVGAYTDAGLNSTLARDPYKNVGFSFGLSLAVPIYDGHQRALKLKKVDLAEQSRQYHKQYFVHQYRQQIAQLQQQLKATDALVAGIRQQIHYSKTLIEANGRLLESGDIRIADYVLALNAYLTAQNQLNQNFINRLRIVNQINYWNRPF